MNNYKDSGIPYIGLIPENWNVLPNKYVMKKIKNICSSYKNEKILSLTMNGVVERDFNAGGKVPSSFDGYQFLYKNNLLMCLFDIDVTPRCIGLIEDDGITSPAYSQFEIYNGYHPKYLYYFYLMLDNTKELLHLSKNLRHSLSEVQLGETKIIVPSIEEQIKISDFLDNKIEVINKIIKTNEDQINDYKKYIVSKITEKISTGIDMNTVYCDSKIGWINKVPSTWKYYRLKDVLISNFSGCWGEDCNDYSNSNICIRIADFDFLTQKVNKSKLTHRKYTQEQISKYTLFEGDVILEKSGGGDKMPVGRTVVYEKIADEPVLFANFCQCLRPNKKIINPWFLAYYLKAMYGAIDMHYYFNQTTGLQNLDLRTYLNMTMCLPTVSEQETIVENIKKDIEATNNLIEIKKNKIDILKKYKNSIIFDYVTGKKEVA